MSKSVAKKIVDTLTPGHPDTAGASRPRPRVAHVTTIDMSLRYLLLNQLRAIRSEGYDVTGISAAGPDVAALGQAGFRHIAVPMTRRITPLRDLRALWMLYRVFRRERFDIVHTHNPKPGLIGQIAARMAGVPLVVNTLHGYYFNDETPAPARRFFVSLEKLAARMSDAILSQSAADVETAARLGIAGPPKIRHLGNGIDLAEFDPATVSADQVRKAREELGIPESAKVVGFVGRLVREKGVVELLKAARLVRAELAQAGAILDGGADAALPPVRFLCIGPVDHHKADAVTPALADDMGVGDLCIFTGLRRDLPPLYALMDVFALPSWREGVPRVPMEASAMGVPCVVTNIRGCREVVDDGETGLLVPPRDATALAEALSALLMDPQRRQKLGGEARKKAVRQFDERLVFQRVIETYAALQEESARRPAVRPSVRAESGDGAASS